MIIFRTLELETIEKIENELEADERSSRFRSVIQLLSKR